MSVLIENPGQIWLAVEPVDLRQGIDGLSARVQRVLGHSPCAGSAFVFRNASGNRIKILLWDGNGVWLCQRRLHQGHFIWPKEAVPCFFITPSQWEWSMKPYHDISACLQRCHVLSAWMSLYGALDAYECQSRLVYCQFSAMILRFSLTYLCMIFKVGSV